MASHRPITTMTPRSRGRATEPRFAVVALCAGMKARGAHALAASIGVDPKSSLFARLEVALLPLFASAHCVPSDSDADFSIAFVVVARARTSAPRRRRHRATCTRGGGAGASDHSERARSRADRGHGAPQAVLERRVSGRLREAAFEGYFLVVKGGDPYATRHQ